jgi:peptide/nickel transport system permease protein
VSEEPRLSPEPSIALDLSRRKKPSSRPPPPPRGVEERLMPYASALRIALDQLERSRLARLGAFVLASLVLTAVFADLFASELPLACRLHGHTYVLPNVVHTPELSGYDTARIADEAGLGDWSVPTLVRFGPTQTTSRGVVDALAAPGTRGHPLGTDAHGRDVFARLVHGTRAMFVVCAMAVLAFAGIGVLLGSLAGFFGGVLDAVIARVIEVLTSFPTLILVLVVQAVLPNPTTLTLLFAIGLTRWTEVARLVRAEVLLVAEQDYVTAARALGASPARVLRRHVLPNAIAPALVAATFGVASVILIEAAVDFLRVGVPDATASWGETLSEARDHTGAWWLLAFPGAFVFVTVAALNLVGEALRDALDPRLRDGIGGMESTHT